MPAQLNRGRVRERAAETALGSDSGLSRLAEVTERTRREGARLQRFSLSSRKGAEKMMTAGATGSFRPRVHPAPAWGYRGRLALWAKRSLGAVFSWLVRWQRLPSVDTSPVPSRFQSVLATADDLEHSLKSINEEIAELENRLRKLAQM